MVEKPRKMILDVGCGDRPRGTVNVDLNVEDSSHLYKRPSNLKKIQNFVCADAQHLPFRNNVFVKVLCWHTLEHLDDPEGAVKEMVRVANGTVQVVVPYRYHEKVQNFFLPQRRVWALKHHKHFFDRRQLQNILKKLDLRGSVNYKFKFGDAIRNFKSYHISIGDFVLFGLLESFFPPTPGELMLTIPK
jgi:ubiquinone/menaquinone biosynthesis C-methylase UbiE